MNISNKFKFKHKTRKTKRMNGEMNGEMNGGMNGGYSTRQINQLRDLGLSNQFINAMVSYKIGFKYVRDELNAYLLAHPDRTADDFMEDMLREGDITLDDGFTDQEYSSSQESQGGKRRRKIKNRITKNKKRKIKNRSRRRK